MPDVTMPQLGETVTEGTITRWMKGIGEQVTRDEPLFEVSTDKVDSEVPAPATGVLSAILVQEGETVEVGARLAVIADGADGADGSGAASATSPGAQPAPPANGGPPPEVAPAPAPSAPAGSAQAAPPPAAVPPPPVATGPGPVTGSDVPAPAPVPAAPAPPPPPTGFVARPTAEQHTSGSAGAGSEPEAAGPDPRLLSPVVRRLLSENGIAASEVTGTGLGGRITREDVLALLDARHSPASSAPEQAPPAPAPAPPAPAPSEPAPAPSGPQPAPAAAATVADAPQAPPSPAPAPPPPPAAPAPPPPPAPYRTPAPATVAAGAPAGGAAASSGLVASGSSTPAAVMRPSDDRVIPFSNMRRRTAEHMVRSKATSPHAFIAYEADFENVERVRRAWKDRFAAEEGFSLTYLPFIARAAVEALREYPNLNASVADDSLVLHRQINLGVAVDLNHEGLIVPVIHRAEEVTLRGIARRVRDLADRARSRQLGADDIAGGTFSITNDGPFGTYFTVPIINQPQVAILATDGIRRRPVVVTLPDGSESIAIHSVGVVGMSWDHRAVDGAYVSSFLRKLAEVLATRDWASEL